VSLILLHQSCTVKVMAEISPQLRNKKITVFCLWGARAILVLRDMKAKDTKRKAVKYIYTMSIRVS